MGVLSYHYGDYGEAPGRGAFLMHAIITIHYRAGAYYPVGGPLRISESIVRVIEKWGGKVLVRAPVLTILIDDKNRAYGVVVKGKEILAKSIVSSVGTPTTMTKLIPESCHSIIRKHIDIMKHKNVASNVSLMSVFVGISEPEGSFNHPNQTTGCTNLGIMMRTRQNTSKRSLRFRYSSFHSHPQRTQLMLHVIWLNTLLRLLVLAATMMLSNSSMIA